MSKPYIIFNSITKSDEKFELSTFPFTIGRDPENTLIIDDPKISQFHLRIKSRGRLLILEDLESENGCYLNGDKVINSILQNGDRILIGQTELKISLPTAAVEFSIDTLNMNLIIDQEHGIEGPINIERDRSELHKIALLGGNHTSILNRLAENVKNIRKIYDLHGNIMVHNQIEGACHALLKSISQLSPLLSRGIVFVWSAHQQQLLPAASKQFDMQEDSFRVNKKALSESLGLKQSLMIKNEAGESKNKFSHRFILPLIHNNNVLCLVHLEADKAMKKFPNQHLEMIQSLLYRCAPSFDSLLLRVEMDALMLGTVETVIASIEAKDTYTVGHSERVCKYSMAIADELKLQKDVKKMLMISSLYHDIGKIGIPDSILKKASLLSREEYDEMKLHPTIGANIISNMPNAKKFISGVKYHHEKWDGTGYPEGLVGENIPFFGRIIAVADVFDAMISGRSYSGFIDESDAIEKIQTEHELFDPEILKALIRAWESGSLTQRTSTLTKRNKIKD